MKIKLESTNIDRAQNIQSRPGTMTDATELKRKRTISKSQFTRAENKLREAITPTYADYPINTVERRYSEVKQRWNQAQDAHDHYVSCLVVDTDQLATEELWIDEVADRFDKIEIEFDKYVEERTLMKPLVNREVVQQPSSSREGVAQGQVHPSVIKIERMKFPSFSGDIRKYPQFREEFIKHIQPQCQWEQLTFVLKSYLVDEIREEVNNVGEDYEKVWERLDKTYGNTGKLVDAILYEVKKLPYGSNCPSITLQMIKIVEKAYMDLRRLGEEGEMCNSTIISIIEQRMPSNMTNEWVKLIASKSLNSRQKFNALMELLQDWRSRLEYMSDNIRTVPNQQGKVNHMDRQQISNRQQSNESYPSVQPNKHRCWLHKLSGEAGEHPIWRCREFLNKSVEERKQLVKSHKACQVCLLTTCPGVQSSSHCRSRFKCREPGCGQDHNRLLHTAKSNLLGISNHTSNGVQGDAIQETTILQLQTL